MIVAFIPYPIHPTHYQKLSVKQKKVTHWVKGIVFAVLDVKFYLFHIPFRGILHKWGFGGCRDKNVEMMEFEYILWASYRKLVLKIFRPTYAKA